MSKPIANPIAFTGQSPPWSLTQLDANFSAQQAAINDTLTYSNYFVDQSGVVNSVIISVPTALTIALTAGTQLSVKIANTNTLSAVTITINALIAQRIINPDGTSLSPGQLVAGGIALLCYDGIEFQFLGYARALSVLSFGADPTGVADATAAFAAAAVAAPAGVNSQGGIGGVGITFAPNATVLVPAGTYTLSSLVNTGGVDITWVLADGALIANYQFLNGRVVRNGRRVNRLTYGIGDFATGYSVHANTSLEEGAAVMGFTAASQVGNYATRDSVGFFVDNAAIAPLATIANAGTTYTATTIAFTTPLTAAQLAQLRSGMLINTAHGATYWTGFMTAWAANSITVSAWYKSDNSGAGTPTNGTGGYANPITKAWAHNANIFILPGSIATAATGFELGTLNNLNSPGGPGGAPLVWGFDAVNLGTYPCEAGHIARGGAAGFYYGYKSTGNGTGFHSLSDSVGLNITTLTGTVGIQTLGIWPAGTAGMSFNAQLNGGSTVNVVANSTTYGVAVTANAIGFINATGIIANGAVSNVIGYQHSDVILNAGASVTNQIGFRATALSSATNNTGFNSLLNAAAGNIAFYAQGTAVSVFGGVVNLQGASAATTTGLGLGNTQQATVGANGAASALTANPLGYLVAYIGATKIAIPYYNG